jgi:hypothetical protein
MGNLGRLFQETTPYGVFPSQSKHITYYYYFSIFILPILPTQRSCLAAVS